MSKSTMIKNRIYSYILCKTTLNCIVELFERAECCNKKLHVDLLLYVTMQFVDVF